MQRLMKSITTGVIADRMLDALQDDTTPIRETCSRMTNRLNIMLRNAYVSSYIGNSSERQARLTGGLLIEVSSEYDSFGRGITITRRVKPGWTRARAKSAIERTIIEGLDAVRVRWHQKNCMERVDNAIGHEADKDQRVNALVEWCENRSLPIAYHDMTVVQCDEIAKQAEIMFSDKT